MTMTKSRSFAIGYVIGNSMHMMNLINGAHIAPIFSGFFVQRACGITFMHSTCHLNRKCGGNLKTYSCNNRLKLNIDTQTQSWAHYCMPIQKSKPHTPPSFFRCIHTRFPLCPLPPICMCRVRIQIPRQRKART